MAMPIFVAGCVAAVVAGACAYLIVADEMRRHYRARRQAHADALRQALITTAFFVALGGLLAVMLPSMLASR